MTITELIVKELKSSQETSVLLVDGPQETKEFAYEYANSLGGYSEESDGISITIYVGWKRKFPALNKALRSWDCLIEEWDDDDQFTGALVMKRCSEVKFDYHFGLPMPWKVLWPSMGFVLRRNKINGSVGANRPHYPPKLNRTRSFKHLGSAVAFAENLL